MCATAQIALMVATMLTIKLGCKCGRKKQDRARITLMSKFDDLNGDLAHFWPFNRGHDERSYSD